MPEKTVKTAKTKNPPNKRPLNPNTLAALNLRLNHKLTYEEIGKIQGISKVSVFNKIKHLIPTQATDDYRNNRADILANTQLRFLQELTPSKLKKISARDAVVSMGILYDKERLERGQATSITDVRSLILELDVAEARALSMLPQQAITVDSK